MILSRSSAAGPPDAAFPSRLLSEMNQKAPSDLICLIDQALSEDLPSVVVFILLSLAYALLNG